jgi:hypothetical protein
MAVTFNNNYVGHVLPRTTLEAMGMGGLDAHGGVLFCSLTFPQQCPGLSITNNIAAGTIYAGFIVPAHNCNDANQRVFRDNIAHSISGGFNGDGAVVYADPAINEQKTCYEVSHFAAYKCTDAGLVTNAVSMESIVHSITSIDNGVGVGSGLGASARDENNYITSMVRDCKFYGESIIDDCPDEDNDQCTILKKSGIVSSIHNIAAHPEGNLELHATKEMHLPLSEQVKDSVWNGYAKYKDIDFYDF